MNIEKFFPFVLDTLFRTMCIACVSAVSIELNFSSDEDYVWFPVVAAAPTPISLLEPSVFMFPYFVYILDDFFKYLLVSHSNCWCLVFRETS